MWEGGRIVIGWWMGVEQVQDVLWAVWMSSVWSGVE